MSGQSRSNEINNYVYKFLKRNNITDVAMLHITGKSNLNNILDVDEISVMDYDNKGIEKCKKRLERVEVDITEIEYPFIKGVWGNTKFLYYVDFVENHTLWNDRGGALEELSLEDCLFDFFSLDDIVYNLCKVC